MKAKDLIAILEKQPEAEVMHSPGGGQLVPVEEVTAGFTSPLKGWFYPYAAKGHSTAAFLLE